MSTNGNKPVKPVLFYNIYRMTPNASGYTHLTIEVRQTSSDGTMDTFSYHRDPLKITWQADESSQSWYAFRVTMEACGAEEMNEIVGIAKSLLLSTWKSEHAIYWGTQPGEILERLSHRGIKMAVYDGRLGHYVYPEHIPDPRLLSWRDDWRTMGRSNCAASALAITEREAQAQIAAELADRGHWDYLKEWIEKGKPVWMMRDDTAPVVQPLEELIKSPGVKDEEKVEVASDSQGG